MIQMAAPRLKTEVDDHYSATVSNMSDKNVLKEIRSRLTADQVALLKQTCFGPLLDVSLKFQGALFHCLLLRELVVADVNPLEMWFDIAGHHVRFSAHEFGLVSGLRLGNLPAESSFQLPTVHRLRDLYFLGSQKIRLKDYREKFTSTMFYSTHDTTSPRCDVYSTPPAIGSTSRPPRASPFVAPSAPHELVIPADAPAWARVLGVKLDVIDAKLDANMRELARYRSEVVDVREEIGRVEDMVASMYQTMVCLLMLFSIILKLHKGQLS